MEVDYLVHVQACFTRRLFIRLRSYDKGLAANHHYFYMYNTAANLRTRHRFLDSCDLSLADLQMFLVRAPDA